MTDVHTLHYTRTCVHIIIHEIIYSYTTYYSRRKIPTVCTFEFNRSHYVDVAIELCRHQVFFYITFSFPLVSFISVATIRVKDCLAHPLTLHSITTTARY